MKFQGFADTTGSFFRKLKKNQNREWFLEHKEEFELGWHEPMKHLLADVYELVDDAFPYCDLDEPKVFRIHRDVRFAKDKAPYKTHVAGRIPVKRAGRTTEVPIALYFHVGDRECFAGSGHYMMDPRGLAKFRAAVLDEEKGRELDAITRILTKKGFSIESHDMLKRVPKGFDPEHPRSEHLRRKGLITRFPSVPLDLLTQPKLAKHLATQMKVAAPLVEWLVYATA
ncbi:MAG: DUF2461 domain-containing protein [Polyangiaceae bacterium]